MKNKTIKKEDIKEKKDNGLILKGIVVSHKMDKTIVISVARFIKHPKYGKYYKVNKKYKAHDEYNKYKIGDNVEIIETRPISKDKHFTIIQQKLS